MIGHGAVFIAAIITSAAASLGLPTSTAPERCASREALSQPTVRISAGQSQSVFIHGTWTTTRTTRC
jgi:hypothetical protein